MIDDRFRFKGELLRISATSQMAVNQIAISAFYTEPEPEELVEKFEKYNTMNVEIV